MSYVEIRKKQYKYGLYCLLPILFVSIGIVKELYFLVQHPYILLMSISLWLLVVSLSVHFVRLTNFPIWTSVVNDEQERFIENFRKDNPREYKRVNLPDEKNYLFYHFYHLNRVIKHKKRNNE